VVTVLRGPVIRKLVNTCRIGAALGTTTTFPAAGLENALVGIANAPPTPAPVVEISLPGTCATQP
jgi:hypothetical protein